MDTLSVRVVLREGNYDTDSAIVLMESKGFELTKVLDKIGVLLGQMTKTNMVKASNESLSGIMEVVPASSSTRIRNRR